MDPHTDAPSGADIAAEAGSLMAGLGIVTIQLFPWALPVLILVIGPLAVLALAGLVLALPILVPVWLFRVLRRRLHRRPTRAPRTTTTPRQRLTGRGTRYAREETSIAVAGRHKGAS